MRRNPPAKWALPETVDPPTRKCIEIQVPDDPAHIAAFRGALLALASAYNWADDTTHKARDVALVWREIVDGMTEWGCTLQTLIAFDDLCGLQWSYDGGATWESASFEACARYGAQQEIQDAIIDGVIQGGTGGQSPQEPPAPNVCNTFHVALAANQQWLCPQPVSGGYSISISNVSGAWTDGTPGWFCPDGNSFGLGQCGDGDRRTEATDPLTPSAYHMQIVGKLLTDSTWFNPVGTAYIIDNDAPEQLFVLQANDQSLGDNWGQIQFDVEVCNNSWVHVFDFTVSNGGFTVVSGEVGTWVSGEGWNGQRYDAFSNPEVVIHKTGFGDTRLLSAVMIYNRSAANGANRLVRQQFLLSGTPVATVSDTGTAVGNGLSQTLATDVTANEIRLWVNSGTGGGTNRIVQLVVTGIGTDPF